MWIIVKLAIVVVTFFIRLFVKKFPLFRGSEHFIDGERIFVHSYKPKNNERLTRVDFDFHSRSLFKLTTESKIDRLFKALGLADEIQTGDQKFDDLIYIASDSSSFRQAIRINQLVRALIFEMFGHQLKSISGNSQKLSFLFQGENTVTETIIKRCSQLKTELEKIEREWKGSFFDGYAVKILVLEATVWSLAIYSFSSFIEWITSRSQDRHLYPNSVVTPGLLAGFIIAIALALFIVVFMKGTSRAHRILIESFLILGFALPVGGIGLYSDVNTGLDRSESIIADGTVIRTYTLEHRNKRGGKSYSYHVDVEQTSPRAKVILPTSIKISSDLYTHLHANDQLKFEIGQGRLGKPWYRSITLIQGH